MTTVKKANEQIRRLRAGLQEARDTLCDHFGPDDASVKACDVALGDEVVPLPSIYHRPFVFTPADKYLKGVPK